MDLAWLDKKIAEVGTTDELRQSEEKLKELPARVDTIIATVRRIATELRPPVLDDLGLEAAIEWQIEEFQERTGIPCEFDSKVRDPKLDPDRATAVFRILQEALSGIVRQARATRASIHLSEEG